jgi:MFS family permease
MILELGIVDDPERVGFYSGLIESIFAVMSLVASESSRPDFQFVKREANYCTVVPCCYISDRYGRKPVILLGFAGLAVSTALFGVSTNFAMMVVTRCFGGAMGAAWS